MGSHGINHSLVFETLIVTEECPILSLSRAFWLKELDGGQFTHHCKMQGPVFACWDHAEMGGITIRESVPRAKNPWLPHP